MRPIVPFEIPSELANFLALCRP
ncbi:unnamed protein product, partial [Rotaria magnacalcarata]